MGGWLTLIKSTLSNLSTYFLSLFPTLVGFANQIEKSQRDFLWGGLDNESKFHLVNWKKVCTPLSLEGLGIREHSPSIRLCWESGYGGMMWREAFW
jgi:hypothetical protein